MCTFSWFLLGGGAVSLCDNWDLGYRQLGLFKPTSKFKFRVKRMLGKGDAGKCALAWPRLTLQAELYVCNTYMEGGRGWQEARGLEEEVPTA